MLQFKQFKLMLRLSRPKTMCFPFFHIYTLMFSKQFTFTHIWMAVVCRGVNLLFLQCTAMQMQTI